MRRRKFIALVGAAGAASIFRAHAQQPKMARIGVLVPGNPEPFWRAFREALRELGLVEGQTAAFELRSAGGKPERLLPLAAELVDLKVNVLVARLTPAVQAAKQATRTIPIVMAGAGDPVGTGLVDGLARPGGNVTGISGAVPETAGKNVELIRDAFPSVRGVAVLANPADSFTKPLLEQIQRVATGVGIAIRVMMIARPEDFGAAFVEMNKAGVGAAIHQPSLPLQPAIGLAIRHRMPMASPIRLFADAGGLMSYSARGADIFQRSAVYVDRILKGERPADLPVEQPTRFELVINLKTAKAMGLDLPPMLIARADEVIE